MKRIKRNISVKSNTKLTKELNKMISKTNQQIKSLLKKGFSKKSLAYDNLVNRLDNSKIKMINKKGLIKPLKNQKLNATQVRALKNSIKNFSESKTSTKTGINERLKNVKSGINEIFDNKLNDNQLNTLSNFFENKKFGKLADKIGGSELLIIARDNVLNRTSKEEFLQDLSDYMEIDADNREDLSELYEELLNA